MALVLNEEQQLLQGTAREFLGANAPVKALRELRDSSDPLGYAPALWQQMAELGWASIILPEQYGGLDFGFLGLGVVLEETGRTLTASPLLASAVVGASALLLGGSEEQKETLLPAIAAGELTTALALEETHHHRPTRIATRAERDADEFIRLVGLRNIPRPTDHGRISAFLKLSGFCSVTDHVAGIFAGEFTH